MTALPAGLLTLLIAYLAGATPFGYLIGRLVGQLDIRQHGSGNIGATNVGRVLGTRWGICVFVLDLAKGLLPVVLLTRFIVDRAPGSAGHWIIGAGIATVVGHMFPCWLGFRGGKGVATALGVVAWLAPWPTVAATVLFALVFLIWRIISLSSIVAALGFAVCQLALLWPSLFSERSWSLTLFSLLVPALILLRHRSNIGRLLRGEEPRYRSGAHSPHAESAPASPSAAENPVTTTTTSPAE